MLGMTTTAVGIVYVLVTVLLPCPQRLAPTAPSALPTQPLSETVDPEVVAVEDYYGEPIEKVRADAAAAEDALSANTNDSNLYTYYEYDKEVHVKSGIKEPPPEPPSTDTPSHLLDDQEQAVTAAAETEAERDDQVGLILGAVLGGLGLVIIIFLGVFGMILYRRRRSRKRKDTASLEAPPLDPPPLSFLLNSDLPSSLSRAHNSDASTQKVSVVEMVEPMYSPSEGLASPQPLHHESSEPTTIPASMPYSLTESPSPTTIRYV